MTHKDVFTPITLALLAAALAAAVAGFVLIPAEAVLPVHWGFSGQPDGFLPRNGALLMPLGILAVVLTLFAIVVRFAAPDRLEPGRHLMRAIIPAIVMVFVVIEVGTVLIGTGIPVDMVRLIAGAVGLLIAIMGNMLPKTQPNPYAGVRFPAAMRDPATWQAANRVAGVSSLLAGAGLVGLALVTGNPLVLFGGVLCAALLPALAGWLAIRRA